MGKSKGEMQVAEYRMSIHMGVCLGPIDAVTGIYIWEKVAWEGEIISDDPYAVAINKPELFGGKKREGGPVGTCWILPGGPDQVMPEALAARLGRTSATCPGFRGLFSLFFVGAAQSIPVWSGLLNVELNYPGFLWSTNSPFIQATWVRCRRSPKGLDPATAMIGKNANPAHMVYECLTNASFGMGAPDTLLDMDSFISASDTLVDEAFGLAMIWVQQLKIEDFVKEILDHIQAALFVDPATGLLALKLIRDDYDFETLQEINPSNASLNNFARKLWGETVNDISVTWTNPANEQEETVGAQDIANITIQGAPINDNRNYYGVRDAELASRLAVRELRASAAPLIIGDASVNRKLYNVRPGSVLRMNWPEYSVYDVAVRVTSVKYGKPGAANIEISFLEDVFSLARPAAITPPTSDWEDYAQDPEAFLYSQVFTMPRYFLSAGSSVDPDTLTYPEVISGILANQPGRDTLTFELLTERVAANGDISYVNVGTRNTTGRAVLGSPFYEEAITTVEGNPLASVGLGPQVGNFVIIGDGTDAGSEIALIASSDGEIWTLDRGVLDTVPRYWPLDTPVWFVNAGTLISDDLNTRAAGQEIDYKLLARTSRGLLDEADAPILTGTVTARPHMPQRPANVKVEGVGFGAVDATALTDLEVTWATRNRLMEDTQVLKWTDGTIDPEFGQASVLSIYKEDGTLFYRNAFLYTETTFTIPMDWLYGLDKVFVEVGAVRNGLVALQAYGVWVENVPTGTPVTPPTPTDGGPGDPPEPEPDPEPEFPGSGGGGGPGPTNPGGHGQWNESF